MAKARCSGMLDHRLWRPALQDKADGLQAHGTFSGAGGELGLVLRADTECEETDKGAQSFCLYGRCHRRGGGGGASVCHVDAAKNMVAQAKENAALSGLENAPIRYIVDDCKKFVEREIRRGNRYDAVIMDPPSYGRGPSGEIWKLEDNIAELIRLAADVLSEKPLFFLVNSYTTGLSPSAMGYMLGLEMKKRFGGRVEADEIGIPVLQTGEALPCGSSARWTAE